MAGYRNRPNPQLLQVMMEPTLNKKWKTNPAFVKLNNKKVVLSFLLFRERNKHNSTLLVRLHFSLLFPRDTYSLSQLLHWNLLRSCQ